MMRKRIRGSGIWAFAKNSFHLYTLWKTKKSAHLTRWRPSSKKNSIQIGKFLRDESALFTGGGVFNSFLMQRVIFHSKAKILVPSKELIEFKESLIFAFLGVLRIRNEVNCLQSVTGAERDNCGGVIHQI